MVSASRRYLGKFSGDRDHVVEPPACTITERPWACADVKAERAPRIARTVVAAMGLGRRENHPCLVAQRKGIVVTSCHSPNQRPARNRARGEAPRHAR